MKRLSALSRSDPALLVHDLKNLTASLLLSVENLRTRLNDPASCRETIETIGDLCWKIDGLIENFVGLLPGDAIEKEVCSSPEKNHRGPLEKG
jgi:hypothetical protein